MAIGFIRVAIIASIVIGGWCAVQPRVQARVLKPIAATVGDETKMPWGWWDFCRRYAGECDGPKLDPELIDLTNGAWRKIDGVNAIVNRAITPVIDMDHWGLVDQWDYPTDGRGDCEDYALLKRKILLSEGFPRQALLMTIVRDTHNEGHAILTVRTSRGDFVLDNLADTVKPWSETGYRFIKRQSEEDPNVWLTIDDGAPIETASN